MALLPFLGAFLEASGMIIEKRLLKLRNLDYKNYPVYSFFAIVILSAVLSGFLWHVDKNALELKNILVFAGVIIFAVIANLLTYYSLKRENISEFEPLWLMQNFFIVLLAIAFYDDERNWKIVAAASIASIALIASHIKRHHLSFDRYNIAVLFAGLFFASELVLSKKILAYYSPISFYFIRCFFIFFILLAVYKPRFNSVGRRTWGYVFLTALIWVSYRVIIYYGYGKLGIIYTTSLVILSPVLMLLFAAIFLKERPSLRQIICNAIIVVCVAASVIFG